MSLDIGTQSNVIRFVFSYIYIWTQWLVDIVPDIRLHGEYDMTHNISVMVSVNHEKLREAVGKAFQKVQNLSNPDRKYILNLVSVPGKIWETSAEKTTCDQMARSAVELEVS